MASTQKIIEQTVSALAERYEFDAAEALEFILAENRKASPALARAIKAVKTTETKIAELEQKIADKKVKNVEKSEETLAGLRTKLAEQNERVNAIGVKAAPKKAVETEPETETEAPKKKRAPRKKAEPKTDTEPETETEAPKKKRAPRKKAEPKTDTEPETETEAPKKKRAPRKKAAEPEPEPKTDTEPETETEAPKKKRAPRKKAETDTDAPAPRYGKKLAACVKKELLAAFNEAEIAWKDAYANDYKTFANAVADDVWSTKAPLDHMKDFAQTKKVVAPESVPEDANVVTLKYNQLLKTSVVDNYGAGVYWDADKKRFVKGPDAVDDEDENEVTFDGSVYMVGETSKRVYIVTDETDVFVGFVGVGKFAAMKV